ncbi:hypothetical protein BDN70DRAFT_943007, partial [Pholiota conissans]
IQWCSSCRDGGDDLNKCTKCVRVYCRTCIEVEKDLAFVCPKCFLDDHKKNKFIPYPFTLLRAPSAREIFPTYSAAHLAVFCFHLTDIRSSENPAAGVFLTLIPWFNGNIVYFDIDFDFSCYHSNFDRRMTEVLKMFNQNPLNIFKQFVVFVTTHSDPRNGYLHISTNNKGAVSAEQLLNYIFNKPFCDLLQRGSNNILGILACGALTMIPESRKQIQDFANRNIFCKILTFSQAAFQPSLSFRFFQDLALNHYVYSRQNIAHLLPDNTTLGAHTGIVEFSKNKCSTYVWSHRGSWPMGIAVSSQCSNCAVLDCVKPQYRKSTDATTVHECSNPKCNWTKPYDYAGPSAEKLKLYIYVTKCIYIYDFFDIHVTLW